MQMYHYLNNTIIGHSGWHFFEAPVEMQQVEMREAEAKLGTAVDKDGEILSQLRILPTTQGKFGII